jgi:hypothetical protein
MLQTFMVESSLVGGDCLGKHAPPIVPGRTQPSKPILDKSDLGPGWMCAACEER